MLKIKEFDDVIYHIENFGYNSAIILLRAMKHDAEKAMIPCPEHGTSKCPWAESGTFVWCPKIPCNVVKTTIY